MHVKHNDFESGTILPMIKSDQQRITHHKRFAIAQANFCFAKTSFMLEMLSEIAKTRRKT